MIKKSLLVFIFLFFAYSIFLMFIRKDWNFAQYQYQANIIKTDKYLYSDSVPHSVIIGSSLAARIITDSIPGVYNLSMAGMTILDGSFIVLKRRDLPRNVFIETNLFYREASKNFIQSFDSPVSDFLKGNFKAFRDENQPLSILKDILKSRQHVTAHTEETIELPQKIFRELLANEVKSYSHYDAVSIKLSVIKLKNIVDKIKARGSNVYFFEMPTNPNIEHSPLANFTREIIVNNFPDIKFIPIPPDKFNTADGLHLRDEEASRYTQYFKNRTKSVN